MHLVRKQQLAAFLALAFVVFGAAADEGPLLDLLSEHVDMTEFEGRVVYVDFWASWCAPCLKSFPWMTELQDSHEEDGLVVLAINVDREEKAARRFLSQHEVSFRILRDPEGKLATAFDVQAMPTSFAFDREGRFAWKHEGFRDADAQELANQIAELLQTGSDDEGGAR